jgi:hypothetical protein
METELLEEAKEVREWALKQEYSNSTLFGYCAICSFELFKRLRAKKLEPIFYLIENDSYGDHCFVICDNFLIDVTATQFDINEPINIIDINEVDDKKWFWNYKQAKQLKTVKQIKSEMVKWPSDQRPMIF